MGRSDRRSRLDTIGQGKGKERGISASSPSPSPPDDRRHDHHALNDRLMKSAFSLSSPSSAPGAHSIRQMSARKEKEGKKKKEPKTGTTGARFAGCLSVDADVHALLSRVCVWTVNREGNVNVCVCVCIHCIPSPWETRGRSESPAFAGLTGRSLEHASPPVNNCS